MITPAPVSTYSIISAATSKPVRRTVNSPTRKGDIEQSKDFADVNVFFIRVFLIAHSIARSTPLQAFRLARVHVCHLSSRVCYADTVVSEISDGQRISVQRWDGR